MKSSVQTRNFRQPSLSAADRRHTLLFAMAADAEKLRAQAQRIKDLREAKSRQEGRFISQETAAHEVRVSARTYRTWEGTGADIKLQNLKALAKYFDTTEDHIQHGFVRDSLPTPDLDQISNDDRMDRLESKLDRVLYALDAATEEEAQRVREALEPLVAAAEAASKMQTTPGPPENPPGGRQPPAAKHGRRRGPR